MRLAEYIEAMSGVKVWVSFFGVIMRLLVLFSEGLCLLEAFIWSKLRLVWRDQRCKVIVITLQV